MWPWSPSKPRAAVLRPCRACGPTVEITRSAATRRAIRNTPASSSRSWPVTVASSTAAGASTGPSSCPSRAPQHRPGVTGQRIHQLLASRRVVVIAGLPAVT